jgi:SEC-C motif-containing protein/uncharacterized protein DUF5677
MESPEDIQSKVEREFDLELAAIRALDVTSDRLLDLWPQQRGIRREGDRVLALSIARGTTTFKGAIRLIEGGFGREALMLNRSLFEGMAVAHWVAANPEDAARRFALANEHEIHLMREKVEVLHPEHEIPDGPGQLSEEDLKEARKLFGQDNQRLWTGHRTIWDLINDVEDQWEEPGRSALRLYLQHEHGRNTKEMHATASAIFGLTLDAAAVGVDGRRGISVRIGPGPDSLDGALVGAFFNHSNLLSLLVSHFELGADAEEEVRRVTEENQYAFAVIDPDQAHDAGRNDPCPCESGKKYKNCHWDRFRRGS